MTTSELDSPIDQKAIRTALSRIPAGLFVFTAAHGDERRAAIARGVQRCCDDPPMLMLAIGKGHQLAPIVRDARHFALCQIDPDDRHTVRLIKLLSRGSPTGFEALETHTTPSGAPIVDRALTAFDCALVRHVDIECDNELWVGHVVHAQVF